MDDKKKALIRDYKHTFGSDHGKRVYDDLMERCRVFKTTHSVENANLTFVMAGMREVGLRIFNMRGYTFLKKKPKKAKVVEQPVKT